MEPISLIITALSSAAGPAVKGAAHGIAQGSAQEAYNDLKSLIKRKIKSIPRAEWVLEDYEKKPTVYEEALKDKLAEAGADKDEEIIKKAQELLKQLKPEDSAADKYKMEFQAEVKAAQIGDRNTQTNTFSS